MKRMLAVFLALVMVFSLAACGAQTPENSDNTPSSPNSSTPDNNVSDTPEVNESAPVYGGELTMMWKEINNYYEPGMMTSYGYGSVWMEGLWSIDLSSDNAYDGSFVTYDQLVGQLADNWTWDEAAGTLTVNIREDVYFHDKEPINGRQLDAEDVKYSYDRLTGLGSGFTEPLALETDWASGLYMLEEVTVDGDFTVVFHFKEENRNEVALNDLITCAVLITSHEWDECPQTWEYAYGTGPYILTGSEIGVTLEFTKNENYYGYDERYPENKLPYLDSITFIEVNDSSNRLAQFISGDLEWLCSTSNVLSTSEIAQLTAAMKSDSYVVWNYGMGRPYGILLRNDTEPFNDVRVRAALQMAIPMEDIHAGYFMYDYEMEIPGLWNPSLTDYKWTWSDEVAAEYEYNPERAKELLTEAGYPNGFEFEVVVCSIVTDVDVYVLAASYLAQIGVTMNITTVGDIMEMISINTDPTETRAMNTTFGGFETLASMTLITSSTGSNYGLRHNNQEFEDLIIAYNNATSMSARAEAAQKLDEIFVTNHWVISTGGIQNYQEFISSSVQGYQGTRIVANNWAGHILSHVWKEA